MRDAWKPVRSSDTGEGLKTRGYLPHWEIPGSTYSITTRLADSLPGAVIGRLRSEREERARHKREIVGRDLTTIESADLELRHAVEIDRYLDKGFGSCILADPEIARIVFDLVRSDDGVRYDLEALAVMPNHLHLVIRPIPGWHLSRIMKTVKGLSSRRMNERLGKRGQNWQIESYDRIVRSEQELARTIEYVIANPSKAGLDGWPWVWPSY